MQLARRTMAATAITHRSRGGKTHWYAAGTVAISKDKERRQPEIEDSVARFDGRVGAGALANLLYVERLRGHWTGQIVW